MNTRQVLLVDDSPEVHEAVGADLELSGFSVRHAYDGRQALADMRSKPPDLVLLDIQMPVMDGFAVLSAMRASPELADVPVIVLSSLDRPNLKVKALQTGADDYVGKQLDRAELVARISRAVERAERQRPRGGLLVGRLEDNPLSELFQTMALGQKDGLVRLPDAGGEAVIEGGRFVRARWRGHVGREALALMLLQQGRFEIAYGRFAALDDTPIGSIQGVLLDLAHELDEVLHALPGKPKLASRLAVAPGVAREAIPEPLRALLPGALATLLGGLPGTLCENAAVVARALGDRLVTIVDAKE